MFNKIKYFNTFFFPNRIVLFTAALVLSAFFAGCLNLEQKTVLKQDGSGSMKIHYWTKISNLGISKEIAGFSFDESRAKANFSSANTDVLSAKLDEKLDDSTAHMRVELKFTDVNKLNNAMSFNKIKSSWIEGSDGMEFTYTVPEDSTNSHIIGAGSYKLIYEVEFPGEVLETNGTKDGNKVIWNKSLADLNKDLVMTATVKKEGKKCGLFGLEFPLLAIAGIMLIKYRSKKRK